MATECGCIPRCAGSGSKKENIRPENEMWEELAVTKAVYRQKGYGGTPHTLDWSPIHPLINCTLYSVRYNQNAPLLYCTPMTRKTFSNQHGQFYYLHLPFPLRWTQSTYRSRVEIGGECICPLSWSVHPTFARDGRYHRVHNAATTTLLRTFHYNGKISPGWWGWGGGGTPTPPSLYCIYHHGKSVRSSWEGKYTLPLFLFHSYIYSVVDIVKGGGRAPPHPHQAGLIFPS